MFLDTYKKAFIAKAAIECMKEVVRYDLEQGEINNIYKGESLVDVVEWQARRAALMARKLADELEECWSDGGHTVFFDPQDQPDNVWQSVANAIERFTEKYFDE